MPSDFGRDLFPALLAQNAPLYGTPLGGYLQDTGTPAAYRQASFDLLAGRVGVHFDNPYLWVSPTAVVGRAVSFLGRNIVDAGAEIGDGAILTDSILLSGAQVASGEHIQDSLIGDGFRLEIL